MKSYLKFLSRNRLFACIQAAGLSISLAFVILIGSYAWQQFSVTQENPLRKQIYTFNLPDCPGLTFAFTENLRESIPEVQRAARYCPDIQTFILFDGVAEEVSAIAVDPAFFDLFPYYGFVEGTPGSLATKEDVLLSESFARAHGLKTGDILHQRDRDYRVAGIVKDFRQTLFKYVDIIAHPDSWLNAEAWEAPYDRFGSTITFAEVVPGADREEVYAKAEAHCRKIYPDFYGTGFIKQVSLDRLDELFFRSWAYGPAYRQGDRGVLRLLVLIGLLLLFSALFNYINLSFALSGKRAREMATRRLLGESRTGVILRQIGESVLFTGVCFALGLLLAWGFAPAFNGLINNPDIPADIVFTPAYLTVYCLLVLLLGTVAGLLPALLAGRYRPVDVVRGTFRHATRMRFSRVFITLQSALAVFLLAMALVMEAQYRHSLDRPLHINIDGVYYLSVQSRTDQEPLRDALSALPCVSRIGFSQGAPGFRASGQISRKPDGEEIFYRSFKMDSIAFEIFRFEKLRDFAAPRFNSVWFGEKAFGANGFDDEYHDISQTLARSTSGCEQVAGTIREFPVNLANNGEEEYLFVSLMRREDMRWGGWVIETVGDPKEAQQAIRSVYEAWSRDNIALVDADSFLADNFREALRPAYNNMRLLELFMLLAILISLLGMLAMSAYFAGVQARGIAVRKVFGGTVLSETLRNVRDYMILVGIACLIGIPLAIRAAERYLEPYIYRITHYGWLFVLAVLLAVAAAFGSVLWQTLRAARTDPASELKKE